MNARSLLILGGTAVGGVLLVVQLLGAFSHPEERRARALGVAPSPAETDSSVSLLDPPRVRIAETPVAMQPDLREESSAAAAASSPKSADMLAEIETLRASLEMSLTGVIDPGAILTSALMVVGAKIDPQQPQTTPNGVLSVIVRRPMHRKVGDDCRRV
jgi:hypothetical protein